MVDTVAEIELIHAHLAQWLGTQAPREVFDEFVAAQHPDFTMVTPEGAVLTRAELAAQLGGAGNVAPGMVIEIAEIEELVSDDAILVARFLETHKTPQGQTQRRVTVVFTVDASARHGLRWLSVHECMVVPDAG